jgi:hypothetical protein
MEEDCFARLGMGRGLTWSGELLQERYDRQCREVHPDAGGNPEDFQHLQRALEVLRSPGQRLRHWLEVEGAGFEAGGSLEKEVMGIFGPLGTLLQRGEAAARRTREAHSALARSLAEREAMAVQAELEAARERIERLMEELCERFGEYERQGAAASREPAGETARSLLFLEKWVRKLREAWAGLLG